MHWLQHESYLKFLKIRVFLQVFRWEKYLWPKSLFLIILHFVLVGKGRRCVNKETNTRQTPSCFLWLCRGHAKEGGGHAWREALRTPSCTQAERGGDTQPQVDPEIFRSCFQLWWTQVDKTAEARCSKHQINSIKAEKENPESSWLQLQGYDIANILRPKISLKTYFRRKTWENKSLDLRQQPLPCQPR